MEPEADDSLAQSKGHVLEEKPSVAPKRRTRANEIISWQRRLLPFMISMLFLCTIFFLVVSLLQLQDIKSQILNTPKPPDLQPTWNILEKEGAKPDINYVKWKSQVTLELYIWQNRYQTDNVYLMYSIWSRYLSFLTGMILAMIGGAFILGKLEESRANLDAGNEAWRFSISTASPGLVLALLGTILIVVPISLTSSLRRNDAPTYLNDVDETTINSSNTPTTEPSNNNSPVGNVSRHQRAEENGNLSRGANETIANINRELEITNPEAIRRNASQKLQDIVAALKNDRDVARYLNVAKKNYSDSQLIDALQNTRRRLKNSRKYALLDKFNKMIIDVGKG